MPGPVAEHPDARRRRNRRATAQKLKPPAEPKGPELPEQYVIAHLPQTGPVTREYCDTTRRWWDTIRRAPQAGAYLEQHWEWLLMLAPLFDRWAALADLDALKELRLQAPPFGLRPSDANKLDWTVDPKVVGPSHHQDDEDEEPDEPPRSGKGSGTAVWYEFATEDLGLEIDRDASRAEIIAAVDARKHGRPARRDPRMRVFDGGAAASGA